eukprot:snap_masked-scaffold_35-processed-gene-1.21-mRNA-1 protein AED:1.00 eAED:1.00 QI:0/0/0/0/1/1/2/0/79
MFPGDTNSEEKCITERLLRVPEVLEPEKKKKKKTEKATIKVVVNKEGCKGLFPRVSTVHNLEKDLLVSAPVEDTHIAKK